MFQKNTVYTILLVTVDDCNAIQFSQSMEIDPNTGYMWVIDTGRRETLTPTPVNACPAKILILDLQNNQVTRENYFCRHLIFNRKSSVCKPGKEL